MDRRLRLASLLSLILLATGLAAIGANSPSNLDIDGDISEGRLAAIRAEVIKEKESSRAVFRRTGGIFRDESDPTIVYVYMVEPDVEEAENVYQELWGGGTARLTPVQRDYSMYQLRA